MKLKDFLNNGHFDINCNYKIFIGIWNDGGRMKWNTRARGDLDSDQDEDNLLEKHISYMTIYKDDLIIEVR